MTPGGPLGKPALRPTLVALRAVRWIDTRPLFAAIIALEIAAGFAYAHVRSFVLEPALLDVQVGVDFRQYRNATSGWLAGEPFYRPWQLAGPYDVLGAGPGAPPDVQPVLYPPTSLALLVPFAALPLPLAAVLWWGVPLTVIGAMVAWLRPRPAAWPVLAYLALDRTSFWLVVSGNPIMWAVAALALGTRWRWAAALVILKPQLAPAALIGARRRSWWIALGVLALVGLAFAPMWPDYLAATFNARTSKVDYLTSNLSLTLLPLVAWLSGRWWSRPTVHRVAWRRRVAVIGDMDWDAAAQVAVAFVVVVVVLYVGTVVITLWPG